MADKDGLQQIKDWAAQVKSTYEVEYNLEGLQKIEEEITKNREAFQDWPEGKQNLYVYLFGSFLGTCMVENYQGVWEKHEATLGVKLSSATSSMMAFPFQKVWKQYQPDGLYDSIVSFYEVSENFDQIVGNSNGNAVT